VDTARLEVEQVLVVDAAHRTGVGTLDLGRLDLEERDRVGTRALVEHEVAVGLVGVGARCARRHHEVAEEHRVGAVLDGALVEQVRVRLRRLVP